MPIDHHELHFGPYRSPARVVIGLYLPCSIRGSVCVVAMSDASIPWPIGEKDGKQSMVIYRGLERAIRSEESAEAIAAAWGVDPGSVRDWRSLLGIQTFAQRQANHRGRLPRFKMKVTPHPEPLRPVPLHRAGNQRPKGHRWTPDEDQLIRRLPVREAAAKLGVSMSAICKRRKLLGLGLHDLLAE